MEKQGLPFFILRALARQLRNWANFVLVGARFIGPHQASADSVETGNTLDASRVASPSAPAVQVPDLEEDRGSPDAEDPSAHWLARADAAQPPVHWLARVQKDAPELLKQQEQSAQDVVKRSPSLPAGQADSNVQRARVDEPSRVEEKSGMRAGRSKQEGEEAREYRDEMDIPASLQNLAPHSSPLPAGQAAGSVQAALAEVAQGTPMGEVLEAESGKREGGKSGARRDAVHSPLWPQKRANGSTQAAHPEVAHRPSIDQATRTKEDSGELAGTGRRQNEENRARRNETNVSASPNSGSEWNAMERMERGKETALTRRPGGNSPPSPGGWVSPPLQAQSSPLEESPGQQAGHNLWPRGNLLAPAPDPRSLERNAASEQGEQLRTEMRWPSLPPREVTTDTQDWEMVWWARERQQRLDEEQRGSSWNA